jgi:hypothetical protein
MAFAHPKNLPKNIIVFAILVGSIRMGQVSSKFIAAPIFVEPASGFFFTAAE